MTSVLASTNCHGARQSFGPGLKMKNVQHDRLTKDVVQELKNFDFKPSVPYSEERLP